MLKEERKQHKEATSSAKTPNKGENTPDENGKMMENANFDESDDSEKPIEEHYKETEAEMEPKSP